MGEKALVEGKINDAIALIKKLDETGPSPTFAAWYYYDDADEWRLLIAAPALDPLLQKREAVAYRKVIEALTSVSPSALGISDLKVLNSKSPLPQALRFVIRSGLQDIAQTHFANCTFNGIFIKEVLILRSA